MILAALRNMRSPSSFQCFVNDDLNSCPFGDKGPNEQQQEEATDPKRRPASMTEDVMKPIEMPFLLQSYRAPRCCDGPVPMCQECSLDKRHDLLPGRSGKSRSEGS